HGPPRPVLLRQPAPALRYLAPRPVRRRKLQRDRQLAAAADSARAGGARARRARPARGTHSAGCGEPSAATASGRASRLPPISAPAPRGRRPKYESEGKLTPAIVE